MNTENPHSPWSCLSPGNGHAAVNLSRSARCSWPASSSPARMDLQFASRGTSPASNLQTVWLIDTIEAKPKAGSGRPVAHTSVVLSLNGFRSPGGCRGGDAPGNLHPAGSRPSLRDHCYRCEISGQCLDFVHLLADLLISQLDVLDKRGVRSEPAGRWREAGSRRPRASVPTARAPYPLPCCG